MVKIRRITPDEIADLKRIEEPLPDADKAIILIAKDETGAIIGRICLVSVAHVEGVWVKPEWRGSSVMARLVAEAEREARDLGLTQLLAFAKDKPMEDYISRLGYTRMPLSLWSKELT